VRAGTNYIGASIAKMMPLTMRILFNVMRQYERAHIGETQKDTQPALGGNNDMDVLKRARARHPKLFIYSLPLMLNKVKISPVLSACGRICISLIVR
jgi:hypothetical protein